MNEHIADARHLAVVQALDDLVVRVKELEAAREAERVWGNYVAEIIDAYLERINRLERMVEGQQP